MTPLRTIAEDYLVVRRSLGFKLETQGHLLMELVGHLERSGLETITTAAAIEWATQPSGASPAWHAKRLSIARRFAVHVQLLDPRCEVPPPDALPGRYRRLPPYIYSEEEIAALMREARQLRPPLRAATVETAIGLLAVTGMRSGEVGRLDRSDIDFDNRTIRIVSTKNGRSRQLTLHESAATALAAYARRRDDQWPHVRSGSFFVSTRGTRFSQHRLEETFALLVRTTGLEPPPGSRGRRPRLHDIRHSVAVTTLVAWYRAGEDVQARLPALSAFLGHSGPSDTFWYFSAVPELLALASERAEQEGRP
jgi:integrase/recombinase XerD